MLRADGRQLVRRCAAPRPAAPRRSRAHDLPADPDRRSGGHLSRRGGARPVPLARRRHARPRRRPGSRRRTPSPSRTSRPSRSAPALTARLEQLFNYPKFGEPFRRGATYFFFKNDGLQNQSVIYRQTGLDGAPEVLLDPNTLSPDGTTKLSVFSVSKDGRRAVYGLSRRRLGLADLQACSTWPRKQPLEDAVEWVKVSGAAWAGDGFFYSRYPAPREGQGAVDQERRPPGVLPPPRHAAVGRRAGVRRPGQSRALPHRGDHRRRALPDPHRVGSRQGQEGQRRLLSRPGDPATRRSCRSSPRSATTPST